MVSSACRTFPPSSLEAPRPKIPTAVFVALVDWSVAPPPRDFVHGWDEPLGVLRRPRHSHHRPFGMNLQEFSEGWTQSPPHICGPLLLRRVISRTGRTCADYFAASTSAPPPPTVTTFLPAST